MARQGGIVKEPSTLVYTLLDNNFMPFDDFELIVRSMHSYLVNSFVPYPETFTVHVKLDYQASAINAHAKLGDLAEIVSVTRLSNFVKDTEIAALEQLRRKYNIGADPEQAPPQQKRAYNRKSTYTRATPYQKKERAMPFRINPGPSTSRQQTPTTDTVYLQSDEETPSAQHF